MLNRPIFFAAPRFFLFPRITLFYFYSSTRMDSFKLSRRIGYFHHLCIVLHIRDCNTFIERCMVGDKMHPRLVTMQGIKLNFKGRLRVSAKEPFSPFGIRSAWETELGLSRSLPPDNDFQSSMRANRLPNRWSSSSPLHGLFCRSFLRFKQILFGYYRTEFD